MPLLSHARTKHPRAPGLVVAIAGARASTNRRHWLQACCLVTLLARAAASGKHDNTKITPIDAITRDLMANINNSFDVEQNSCSRHLPQPETQNERPRTDPRISAQLHPKSKSREYCQAGLPPTAHPTALNHQQLQRRWHRTTTT